MLSLHSVKKSKGGSQKRKRVGRGNSSGHGTYSTKGLKGQKARSGVSGLKRLGMKKQLLQMPKVGGFVSLKPKNQVVNIQDISRLFKDNEVVNPESLLAKKLISNTKAPIKILGRGLLTTKGLKLEGVKMSEKVKSQLK